MKFLMFITVFFFGTAAFSQQSLFIPDTNAFWNIGIIDFGDYYTQNP
ncbi:hypothetical protein [Putridiphycobacter roseus]|nr:hypothetical protein [Putridiphycobacter roseus]